jgi:hypothetical protein
MTASEMASATEVSPAAHPHAAAEPAAAHAHVTATEVAAAMEPTAAMAAAGRGVIDGHESGCGAESDDCCDCNGCFPKHGTSPLSCWCG